MSTTENTNETVTETEMTATKTQGQGQKKSQGQTAKKAPKPAKEKKVKEPKAKKEKPVREKPAHMSKVDKVAQGLPALDNDSQVLFTAICNMSTASLNSLAAHINIEIRRRGVRMMAQGQASGVKLEVGQRVKVVSGQQPRFIGMSGTVAKVQRIRCYVRLDGRDKDDYFFIADVASVGNTVTQGSLAETVARLSTTPTPIDLNTIEDEDHNSVPATRTNRKTG